ncbi:MAG TPA: thioredoxin-dependent thiol peroxidase [Candidatus Binataceae bacterium]|nr:thioredoxin-dependent thiol peroxidase [Candidatus Binataceae bacterium]
MAKAPNAETIKAVVRGTAHAMEGRKAPPFELDDGGGKTVSLKELLGRGNLVLYFYPKDMTPGCTIEACDFRDTTARLKALGAQVVGVSADPPASHRKFTDKHALNFPLLSDPDNRVTRLYGVYKKKSLYGREFMGIERTTFVIDRAGVIRKVFPKVKVAGHADAVVEAVKALR